MRNLLREAKSAAQLNHPHIVTVYDLLKGDSPTFKVPQLLKRIARAQAEYNFDIIAVHVDREKNKLSDMLSRFVQIGELQPAHGASDGWGAASFFGASSGEG